MFPIQLLQSRLLSLAFNGVCPLDRMHARASGALFASPIGLANEFEVLMVTIMALILIDFGRMIRRQPTLLATQPKRPATRGIE